MAGWGWLRVAGWGLDESGWIGGWLRVAGWGLDESGWLGLDESGWLGAGWG